MANSSNHLKRERWNLLISLRDTLSPIMDSLAVVWLLLTVFELSKGLSPLLENIVTTIWIVFAVHFFLELILAPKKKVYLKHNWLTAFSLILPAFRVLRFLRFFRYLRNLRGLSLVKILSAINRGMRALSKSLARRVFIYVLCLTFMVVLLGAAGILNFESELTDYFQGFGSALWWSAMMVTTMGSDYFPESAEGRVLAFTLAVYGFAIFGYVAATLASYLFSKINNEKKKQSTDLEIGNLRDEIIELKSLIREMMSKNTLDR